MSVYCNVKLTNGNLFYMDYACYGFLRCWDEGDSSFDCWYESSQHRIHTGGRPKAVGCTEFVSTIEREHPGMIEYIEPDLKRMNSSVNISEHLKEMKAFIKDLPMFSGCLSVIKSKDTIRATVGDNQADKYVLALMSARMVLNATENSSYVFARNHGYRPRTALLFASMFYCHLRYNPSGPNRKVFNYDRAGENVIVYMPTFGTKDLKDYMNQTRKYQPWYQEPFADTTTGYSRDYDFFEMGEVFNSSSVEPESDDNDLEDLDNWEEVDECENTFFRRLNSCFSRNFGNDTPIEELMYKNEYNEYCLKSEFVNADESKALEVLEIFESYINKET